MPSIFDKRSAKNKHIGSKKKFLKRVLSSASAKQNAHKTVKHTNIDKLFKGHKRVKIDKDDLVDADTGYNNDTGQRDIIQPNNQQYKKGQIINKPPGGGSSSGGGDGDDEARPEAYLSEDEFLQLVFDDLYLPNFIKQTDLQQINLVKYRAGYSRVGSISNLDLKKTYLQALSRRKASADKENTPFLDDEDMRFKRYAYKPNHIKKAIMFCLLDISGSINENELIFARAFYGLLMRFLFETYTHVEPVFIQYTTEAEEVTQRRFFQPNRSGGTAIAAGYEKVLEILKTRYKDQIDSTNIYVANLTDGEDWADQLARTCTATKELLDIVAGFFYIELVRSVPNSNIWVSWTTKTLFNTYEATDILTHPQFRGIQVSADISMIPVIFRKLFQNEKHKKT